MTEPSHRPRIIQTGELRNGPRRALKTEFEATVQADPHRPGAVADSAAARGLAGVGQPDELPRVVGADQQAGGFRAVKVARIFGVRRGLLVVFDAFQQGPVLFQERLVGGLSALGATLQCLPAHGTERMAAAAEEQRHNSRLIEQLEAHLALWAPRSSAASPHMEI